MASKATYPVAITVIVAKGDKFLIVKRSKNEKRFPGIWTVPGGKVEPDAYQDGPKDTENAWYNVLETVAIKETREEVGLTIGNVQYLLSLMADYGDTHGLVISCWAEYVSGEVTLQADELDEFAWVTVDEAKNYEMIDGILEEMALVTDRLNGETSL